MHTPGPWMLEDLTVFALNDHFCNRFYAQVQRGHGLNPGELEANARLMLAAPDMLAALKLIWSMFNDGRIVRNIANDGNPDWALKMLNFTRELQTIQLAIAKAEGRA
jgi:hypothetical protein